MNNDYMNIRKYIETDRVTRELNMYTEYALIPSHPSCLSSMITYMTESVAGIPYVTSEPWSVVPSYID